MAARPSFCIMKLDNKMGTSLTCSILPDGLGRCISRKSHFFGCAKTEHEAWIMAEEEAVARCL